MVPEAIASSLYGLSFHPSHACELGSWIKYSSMRRWVMGKGLKLTRSSITGQTEHQRISWLLLRLSVHWKTTVSVLLARYLRPEFLRMQVCT